MIETYYTYRALAQEWDGLLAGCTVGRAYTQAPGELSLPLFGDEEHTLRISVEGRHPWTFRAEGHHRARRNTVTLLEEAEGREVTGVRTAERDRVLFLDLSDGWRLQALLFGARANVLLVDAEGRIVEAFKRDDELAGTEAPAPRAAPMPDTREAFEGRWRTNRKRLHQTLSSTLPLFDRTLATEVAHRAGLDAEAPPEETTEVQRDRLWQAAEALRGELETPAPHVYWRGDREPDAFALVPFEHLAARDDLQAEASATVDEAVRLFLRRRLAVTAYREAYEPLADALRTAADDARRSAERMLEQLAEPSRAERHEQHAHLLMAHAHDLPRGAEEAELPDLFGEGETVVIELDPKRTAIQHAEWLYDKARRTRKARASAEDRLVQTEEQAEVAERLLAGLEEQQTARDVRRWREAHEKELAPFVQTGRDAGVDRVPFRRYDLGGGYEAWVGRNARQNDELTTRHARKWDRWLHARGVPGSHVVLRIPHRDTEPPKSVVLRAARLAAYYSKARGSSLVPVIVAERKHIRKPKGGAPGAVLVEHEDVVLVEPGVP